jgi:DNA-binding NarL/FixJ family response regulator
MRLLNVVVADDHPIFVEGLQAVFSKPGSKFSCRINGVARNAAQVTEMLRHSPADLLLMDLSLPEMDGVKIIPSLKKGHAKTRVLVMTVFDDPRLVKAAFKAGADGYMLKTGTQDELLHAIETVVEGHTFLGAGLTLSELRSVVNGSADSSMLEGQFARKFGLTRREMEIMRYIGQALNNKEIAERLYISDQTVSVHRKNIMRKLGVNNTASLIKIAYDNNLV